MEMTTVNNNEVAILMAKFCHEIAQVSHSYATKLSTIAGIKLEVPADDKKKKKRAIDPNAPKRPQSAYVRYLQDTRPKIVKENPDLKQTEIMAKIGGLWSTLPEPKKKKYLMNYEKDLKKWEKDHQKYLESKGMTPAEASSATKSVDTSEAETKEPGKAPKTPEKTKSTDEKKPKGESSGSKKKKKLQTPDDADPTKKEKAIKRKNLEENSEKKAKKKK